MAESSLPTLLRLRRAAREESQAALRRAEEERDAQAARLAAVRDAIVTARAALSAPDAFALTSYHEFRARQEVLERREAARLQQRDRELELKRSQHTVRVREELAIEHLIARKDAEAAHEERRRDQARMDELGLRAGGHP